MTGFEVDSKGRVFEPTYPARLPRLPRRRRNRKVDLLAARDGRFCQHCHTTENLTVDHVIAKSRGGSNRLENLQLLCFTCNGAKGNG